MCRFVAAVICGAAFCVAAEDSAPAPFDYRDFTSRTGLNIVGSARYVANFLRLTAAREQEAGGVWHVTKEPITSGFDTTFQFRLTQPGGLGLGADGLAFVLQNHGPSSLAGRGSAGGWGLGDGQRNRHSSGIPRAIAIFFDTFQNNEAHDPSNNFIGIFNNGGPREMRWPPPRVAYTPSLRVWLKDSNVHTARILYRPPLMSVYLDDLSTPVLTSPLDISLVADAGGRTWVGFTASTGAGYENHDILAWSFNTTEVTSAMVSSNISFFMDQCRPGRNLCTPDQPIIEQLKPGRFHIVLPANLEWGAAIPNPSGREVLVENARGSVCWDLQARGPDGCSGPDGSPLVAGPLAVDRPAGALILKTSGARTYFSVNDRKFDDNEGYFEFEVELK
jgi:Legume lectin domain